MDAITVEVTSAELPRASAAFRITVSDALLKGFAVVGISTGAVHLQTYMTAEELADLSAACLAARDALTQTEPA